MNIKKVPVDISLIAERQTRVSLNQIIDLMKFFTKVNGELQINVDAGKTLVLSNPVWDDINWNIATGRLPAANAPTWETFSANTKQFSFAVNDYLDLGAIELLHWWKEGSIIDMHLHVVTKAAQNTGSNRFAKFTIYLAYADSGEVFAETSATAELTIPTGTAALHHFYVDLGTLDLANNKIGTQIVASIKRIAATGGTEYSGNIFITQVGAHCQKDTMGSRLEHTK